MAENSNGSRISWNRRFRIGLISLCLTTINYYVVMFAGKEIVWFTEYAKIVVYISGTVILGLTATNVIYDWKGNNKG